MKALEVKYLLEQMQKVEEDKVRLEKELLAALLERDQQIVQVGAGVNFELLSNALTFECRNPQL